MKNGIYLLEIQSRFWLKQHKEKERNGHIKKCMCITAVSWGDDSEADKMELISNQRDGNTFIVVNISVLITSNWKMAHEHHV